MLEKPRVKPYQVLCYEALFRRLKPQHRNNRTIRSDFRKYDAGYYGEKHVDYMLSTASMKNTATYCDIRLSSGSHDFQMDTLVATPSVMVIIEIKNFTGELEYDHQYDQFIQTVDTEKKRMINPLLQSETQKRHLTSWLQAMNMPRIPIELLSVISNPNAILKNSDPTSHVFDRLIHAEVLPRQFQQLLSMHKGKHYNPSALRQLNTLIHKHDNPRQPDLIRQYNLQQQHFIQGVICPSCEHYPMKRLREKWSCLRCGATDKHAHEQAIYDYFLLHKKPITNQACRRQLKIDNPHIAFTLLNAMNLRRTGSTSTTVYHAPNLKNYPQNSDFPGKRVAVLK